MGELFPNINKACLMISQNVSGLLKSSFNSHAQRIDRLTKCINDKSVIIMGTPASGKSILFYMLSGTRHPVATKKNRYKIIPISSNASITMAQEFHQMNKILTPTTTYFDCPSYFKTEGTSDVVSACMIGRILLKSIQIKLVFTLSIKDLEIGNDSSELKQFFKHILKLFENIDKLPTGIAIIVTKTLLSSVVAVKTLINAKIKHLFTDANIIDTLSNMMNKFTIIMFRPPSGYGDLLPGKELPLREACRIRNFVSNSYFFNSKNLIVKSPIDEASQLKILNNLKNKIDNKKNEFREFLLSKFLSDPEIHKKFSFLGIIKETFLNKIVFNFMKKVFITPHSINKLLIKRSAVLEANKILKKIITSPNNEMFISSYKSFSSMIKEPVMADGPFNIIKSLRRLHRFASFLIPIICKNRAIVTENQFDDLVDMDAIIKHSFTRKSLLIFLNYLRSRLGHSSRGFC